MKKIISVIISIIFTVCLMFTLLLSVVRVDFSFSSLTKIAGEILKPVSKASAVKDGLFHPEDIQFSLADYDYGDFDMSDLNLDGIDFTNLDVNELVQSYLDAAGVEVEPEFIAEVLASPEVSEFVDKYAGEVISYVTGSSEELKINPDDIKKVMNKSLDMYEVHTGEVVDRSGLDKAIEENVVVMQTEITAALDNAKEENAEVLGLLKKVEFFLSSRFYMICIGICVLFVLILFLLKKSVFSWLQFVFLPFFIDGIIIFIAVCCAQGILPGYLSAAFKDAGLPGGVYEGIWAYLTKFLIHLKICGALCAAAGIAFWTLCFSLGRKTAAA